MLFERTKIELRCFLVVDEIGREHFTEETTHFKEAVPPQPWPVRFLRLLTANGSAQWLESSRSFALVNGGGPLNLNGDGTFSHASTGLIYKRKMSDNRVGAFAEYDLPFKY